VERAIPIRTELLADETTGKLGEQEGGEEDLS
jgi:hypothetical protein